MDNYVVSARKYRPATFDTVVGQRALTETLRNAIRQNHLAHAYLFCGPRGVGKTTCARIFAKTINCLNPTDGHDACNECESCQAFNEQRSFNIHELDAASNNSVEDIRTLIQEVRIPPQIGKYSVYIIDEVHMLSQGAFNALLKTLEEPPSYAIFILATTEKHKVLPTILSRCQVYDFARITVADIIAHLQYVAQKEGVTVGEDALNVVAQKADGGMRDALSIFDQLVAFCGNTITYEQTIEVLNVLDSDYYFRLVETALKHDVSGALLLLNDVLQRGFDAGNFITGFAQHLRDVLVSKDAATIELLETSDAIRQHYAQQAKQCDAQWLFKALDIVNTCDINYRTARNKRLTVELSLVKLTQLGVQTPQVSQAPQVSQQTPASKPTVAPQPKAQEVAQPKTVEVAPSKPAMQAPPKMATIPYIPSLNTNPSVANQRAQATASNRPSEGVAQSVTSSGQEENRPFTLDQFRGAWAGLYTIFKEEPRLLAILKEYTPELIDEQHCVLTLSNPWQKTAFKQFGKSVMDHMRATLHNSKLQLTLQVDETTVVQKAYTAEEKYKVLLGKNEELANLKTALALQLE